ncbi:hypothetical protein [Ekhidna sp.]
MNESITIHDVWQKKTDELIEEIVAFWTAHNAIPPHVDINQRAHQVVLVVRNLDGEIVGVTTAYSTKYPLLKSMLFVFRGMLDPGYRIPGLFIKMTTMTIQLLERHTKLLDERERPIGMIAEVENPNLKEARMTKSPSGMTLIGFSKKENPIYAYYFKGARF